MTCRRRMKHPRRTLPPPHVARTHISSSLECEIKARAPSGGFGPRPLPSQVNTVCEMRWLQKESKPRPLKSAGDTLPETFLTNLAVWSQPTYIDIPGHGAGGFCALCCIFASREASPGSWAQRVCFYQEAGLGGTRAPLPAAVAWRRPRQETTWAARGHGRGTSGPLPAFWTEDAIS